MIATRIKEIRSIVEMSQQEFGQKLGVSRDVISNIEYGRVEPKELFLTHLCNIFNININWLVSGEGEISDTHIESKKNINEAMRIFKDLSPGLQDHALKQIKLIYDLQEQSHESQ